MQEHQTVLGGLKAQLQELQVRPPQVGTFSTHLATGSSTAEQTLCARMENTIVLPEGALVAVNVTDRFSVNMSQGLGLNLAALPRETLYLLQDGITTKLQARESHAIQVLSEQKINMEQLILQHDELVSQNQHLEHMVDAACRCVPELAIPANLPTEVQIHRLATGVREAREETTKVQLELNL